MSASGILTGIKAILDGIANADLRPKNIRIGPSNPMTLVDLTADAGTVYGADTWIETWILSLDAQRGGHGTFKDYRWIATAVIQGYLGYADKVVTDALKSTAFFEDKLASVLIELAKPAHYGLGSAVWTVNTRGEAQTTERRLGPTPQGPTVHYARIVIPDIEVVFPA